MAGKRTGFSRVFPHVSTQVVDFPHLSMARHFLDVNFANERELGKEFGQGETEPSGGGTNMGELDQSHGFGFVPLLRLVFDTAAPRGKVRAAVESGPTARDGAFWRGLPKQTVQLNALKCA